MAWLVRLSLDLEVWVRALAGDTREVKLDVYGKRQTAKKKLLPSVFSSLYSKIKIFVFTANSKRHFYFCMIYLRIA